MRRRFGRRVLLRSAAAAALLSSLGMAPAGGTARADRGPALGPPQPFGFESLTERARALAATPYVAPARPAPEVVQQIDYDAHGAIQHRREEALFVAGPGPYPITLFPLGRLFAIPARLFVAEGAEAREVRYESRLFEMPADSVAHQLPADVGFAGFRVHEPRRQPGWQKADWAAFLGASYFRAIGSLGQYGLSARGVAVDTAEPGGEEFPLFRELYITPAPGEGEPVMVHALLDGPSITGAYRFALRRTEGVVMELEARLFLRRDIARLGIAPLTSMYWFAEPDRRFNIDWRPEVHDSDGLAIWNGRSERLFRPLANPGRLTVSSFLDDGPRGFGLLQRDRDPDHYLDGVDYHLRPSLWVEPLDDWGPGAVQLVEIPTHHEAFDNIVAFWVPAAPASAGAELGFRYRLHWLADVPWPAPELARCVALHLGRGRKSEVPGLAYKRLIVIQFAGGPLQGLAAEADVELELEVSSSRGAISQVVVEPISGTERWLGRFDLEAAPGETVELRASLQLGGRAISETWLYALDPGEAGPG